MSILDPILKIFDPVFKIAYENYDNNYMFYAIIIAFLLIMVGIGFLMYKLIISV